MRRRVEGVVPCRKKGGCEWAGQDAPPRRSDRGISQRRGWSLGKKTRKQHDMLEAKARCRQWRPSGHSRRPWPSRQRERARKKRPRNEVVAYAARRSGRGCVMQRGRWRWWLARVSQAPWQLTRPAGEEQGRSGQGTSIWPTGTLSVLAGRDWTLFRRLPSWGAESLSRARPSQHQPLFFPLLLHRWR